MSENVYTLFPALTAAGQALDAKMKMGTGIALELTRVTVGAGWSNDPLNLTAVVDERMEMSITERSSSGPMTILVCFIHNMSIPPNEGVTEGFPMSQVGFYALDPDIGEILYMIFQPDIPRHMFAENERPMQWRPRFSFYSGNASEVIVQIDPAGLATMDWVNDRIAQIPRHGGNRVWNGATMTAGNIDQKEVQLIGAQEDFSLRVGDELILLVSNEDTTSIPTLVFPDGDTRFILYDGSFGVPQGILKARRLYKFVVGGPFTISLVGDYDFAAPVNRRTIPLDVTGVLSMWKFGSAIHWALSANVNSSSPEVITPSILAEMRPSPDHQDSVQITFPPQTINQLPIDPSISIIFLTSGEVWIPRISDIPASAGNVSLSGSGSYII